MDSNDPTIKRNAISIKNQLSKLEDEFYKLREDDKDFSTSYEETDLFDWLLDHKII